MDILSLAFILFLVGVCAVYYVVPRPARAAWLLCCSYLFYLYDAANAAYVAVLIAATVLTYGAGLALEALRKVWLRRVVLGVCVAACMGGFFVFKYYKVFADAANGLLGRAALPALSLVMPLGISYFSFMALGYVIDVYRRKAPAERDFFYYALFVSFFPCIFTGPIERAGNMLPQFKAPPRFDYERFAGGVFRILWGFFKKLVLAGILGQLVDNIYLGIARDTYPGPLLLAMCLGFCYQLYIDFSAATDIAVGAGALLGIRVMENFRRPFAAKSFTELWRRWHISLTGWFRDYLYISLGGNRRGKARQYFNQLAVFFASGLWHGATLPYVVWGLANGAALCIGKATAPFRRRLEPYNPLYHFAPLRAFFKTAVTYLVFAACFVFFVVGVHSGTLADAGYLFSHFFTGWGGFFGDWDAAVELMSGLEVTFAAFLAMVFSILLVEGFECAEIPVNQLIRKVPFPVRLALYYVLVLFILFFGAFGKSGFVYQEF